MLHIITAFHIEAIPLIKYFQLKKLQKFKLFETYANHSKSLSLTICGMGKMNASASIIYTASIFPDEKPHCWLNIGSAGHKTMDLGTIFIANKVIDGGSNLNWYPQIIFQTNLPKYSLITVDKPTDDYPDNHAIDMEASGFYSSATKIGSCELIHCLKIISDNQANDFHKLNKIKIEAFINANLVPIESTINCILELQTDMQQIAYEAKFFEEIISIAHFTHTQQIQLKKILGKWNALIPDSNPDMKYCAKLKNAKSIIDYLHTKTNQLPVNF